MGCELIGDKKRLWFLGRKDFGTGSNLGDCNLKAGCGPCLTPTLQTVLSSQRGGLGDGGGGEGIPQGLGLMRLGVQALPPSSRPLFCQSAVSLGEGCRPTLFPFTFAKTRKNIGRGVRQARAQNLTFYSY